MLFYYYVSLAIWFPKKYDVIYWRTCMLKNFQIVKAVVSHEAALKAQAKKMNVESLRSNTVSFLITFGTNSTKNIS